MQCSVSMQRCIFHNPNLEMYKFALKALQQGKTVHQKLGEIFAHC